MSIAVTVTIAITWLDVARRNGNILGRTLAIRQAPIACQGMEWKTIPVQVIFEVEDAWKACPCEMLFVPGAVELLALQQILDCTSHCRVRDVPNRQQSEQAPCRLRRSALTPTLETRIIIRRARLAPASVSVLDCAQPGRGATAALLSTKPKRCHGSKHPARPVNVVDAPPAVPSSLGRLVAVEEVESPLHDRMRTGPAGRSKKFQHPSRHVGRRRIDHRIVVGKGNVSQGLAVVIAIEGSPAAIAVLHAHDPVGTAAHGVVEP